MRDASLLQIDRAVGGAATRPHERAAAEPREHSIEIALREVLALTEGSAPAPQRLAQVRRRVLAALALRPTGESNE